MAKSFYNLEEAAAKLGLSPEQVSDLAQQNKLQQYRNGDKLMFKVDQVDAMANSAGQDDSMGPLDLADSGDSDGIQLSEESAAGKTDAINLADATDVADSPAASSSGSGGKSDTNMGSKRGDSRQATGVSVFDADEVVHADPAAQTHVTHPTTAEEELALESVGSGQGLAGTPRTRKRHQPSAPKLLDEIYPRGAGTSSAADIQVMQVPPCYQHAPRAGSSGVLDGAHSDGGWPSWLDGHLPVRGHGHDERARTGRGGRPAWLAAVALPSPAYRSPCSGLDGSSWRSDGSSRPAFNHVSRHRRAHGIVRRAIRDFRVTGRRWIFPGPPHHLVWLADSLVALDLFFPC